MTIAFVDGPVITGDGRILEHATVLVQDDKIVKVAEAGISIPFPQRDVHLDTSQPLEIRIKKDHKNEE